jgi:tetratricopeptide (TPR) repeat protein
MRILAALLILAATPAMAAEYTQLDDLAIPGSSRYERCLSLAHSSPKAAYEAAQKWNAGAPAEHCEAVALTGMKQYVEAAKKLDVLARDTKNGTPTDRATLFDQAGNAWLLAKHPAQASDSFTAGLVLAPDNADLLMDRARASAMSNDWASADRDLTAALLHQQDNPELYVLRASARHALGRKKEARADIDQALHLNPAFSEALLQRAEMEMAEGDEASARADWQAVVDTSPNTGAAKEARAKLAELEPDKGKPQGPAVPAVK